MTSPTENGRLQYVLIPFPDSFDICWAGPNLVDPSLGFCFGSTDGMLLFTDKEGRPFPPISRGTESGEAINGVARAGSWIGISTRQEVNFWPLAGTPGHTKLVVSPFGAHGITSTADGYFIAPLGQNGIMAVKPSFGPDAIVQAYGANEAGLYAYRIAILGSRIGAQVIGCASRTGGIAAGEFIAGEAKLIFKRAMFPGVDVVDICPLEPETESRAVAVLGRDGSLFLFPDVLNKKSFTMKFETVQGVGYRILSSHGDIYVLTSKGLYVLGELAGRFVRKELFSGVTTPVRVSPMQAVDMNLAHDRWLLVVQSGSVARFDLEAVHKDVLDHLVDAEIQESQPTEEFSWESGDIQTTSRDLVGA